MLAPFVDGCSVGVDVDVAVENVDSVGPDVTNTGPLSVVDEPLVLASVVVSGVVNVVDVVVVVSVISHLYILLIFAISDVENFSL